jgi:xylulokinase
MIIGIDIGTQSLKALLVDEDFRVMGEASRSYDVEFPRPGWAEQRPGVWEGALGPAISAALSSAGVPATRIEALGIAGQVDGCVAVNAAGEPLSPCLIWMDRRAESLLHGIPADEVRNRTGVILDASHMAAKIRWLGNNLREPEQIALYHQPVSYMVARLTGRSVLDHGVASTTMLYSLQDRQYDFHLLELFEIEADTLPVIEEASAAAGTLNDRGAALTGLPRGIPVAVGTGDDFSNLLGSGETKPGRLICTVGTAEVVGALHTVPAVDARGLVETHSYPGGLFFIENPGWLSGGALRWLIGLSELRDFEDLDRRAAQAPPGADGLLFIPALTGAMAPEWIPSARGCFYGLTPAHGVGHLARAVLEGCAFAMRDVAERLNAMSVKMREILLLGGGARSRLWGRIRADVSSLPVVLPQQVDTSPVGAAMLATVAAGLHSDLGSCVGALSKAGETLEPNPLNRAVYDESYSAYRRLFNSLRPMYQTVSHRTR